MSTSSRNLLFEIAFFDGFYILNGVDNGISYFSWVPVPLIQTFSHLLNVIFHAFDCICWFFSEAGTQNVAWAVAIHGRHHLFLKLCLNCGYRLTVPSNYGACFAYVLV